MRAALAVERCGYCGESLAGAGVIHNPFRGGPRYHGKDCWPRARLDLTGEPFIQCRECGQAEANQWLKDTAARLMEKQLCFSCDFWDEWCKRDATDERSVRINGTHYHIGEEGSKSGFRGFSGREFNILFFDGREVRTTNLWHQGEIPAHYRERLPDNAEWAQR